MRRLWLLGVLLLLSACAGERASWTSGDEPEPPPSPAVEIRTGNQWLTATRADGTDGRYLLHVPAGHGSGRPAALVLVFHGAPGTAQEMVRMTDFGAVADDEGFLVAYPDAFDAPEDVEALLDDVAARTEVDPRRVYATGFSRGASTTYLLAAELADRIAAFAPVSGLPYDVPPTRPTSLIAVEGLADDLASGFPDANRWWARYNRCRAPSSDTARWGDREVQRTVAACEDGTQHVVHAVPGMGHAWPREATRVIWEFFEAHPLARG